MIRLPALLTPALLAVGGLLALAVAAEMLLARRLTIGGLRLAVLGLGLAMLLAGVVRAARARRFFVEEALPFAAALTPFLVWVANRTIELDFWYDELVTLNRYVFVPLQVTLTDYTFPNNHIFLNLLNNLYLKAAGLSQVTALMDHPSFIRNLMLFYALVGSVYVYLAGREFISRWVGLFSVLVLATSIPFFNFAAQVRGYGLSIALTGALLFHGWRSAQAFSWRHLAASTAAAALLIYTIPSNIYIPASLAAWNILTGGRRLLRGGLKPLKPATLAGEFPLAFASLAGLALAIALYSPMLPAVMNNSVVNTRGLFNPVILTKLLPRVLLHFVSARWLLAAPALAGLALLLTRADRRENPGAFQLAGGMAFLLLAPFLFSFVRGDPSFDRIYLAQLPAFSLLIGIGLHLLLRRLPRASRHPGWAALLLGLYAALVFSGQVLRNEALTRRNNAEGKGTQNIYTNYYLVDFKPDQLMRDFFSQQDEQAHEFLIYNLGDNAAAREYSARYFGYYPNTVDSLRGVKGIFYIITAFPDQFLAEAAVDNPRVTCERLNREVWYQNIFLCQTGATAP